MRFAFVRLVAALVGALVVLAAAPARANGRFPESNAIFFAPGDPQTVIVRATFGLLVSHDRGGTWDWVCEPAVGLVGVEDPMLGITPDGTIVSTTFQGLAVSHDRACSWAFVGGPLASLVFVDSASRPGTPGAVVALASSFVGPDPSGDLTYTSSIFETTDQGRTFAPVGPPVDPLILGRTIDVTNTDPDRIYVSGVGSPGATPTGVLLTSRDHGLTFVKTVLPLVGAERGLFIAGVDPVNADRLYARTAGDRADDPSRLLVSDDAGQTFRTIYTGVAALQGFALSDDGSRIWVGGPKDGLLQASAADYRFVPRTSAAISCLKFASDGLWACSSEASGFVLGLSHDDGATFEPKLHFCDVRGPLACGAGTSTHEACTLGTKTQGVPPWPAQQIVLSCGVVDGGADAAAAAPARFEAGGCSLPAPSDASAAPLLTGVGALLAVYRRRRRAQRDDAISSSR